MSCVNLKCIVVLLMATMRHYSQTFLHVQLTTGLHLSTLHHSTLKVHFTYQRKMGGSGSKETTPPPVIVVHHLWFEYEWVIWTKPTFFFHCTKTFFPYQAFHQSRDGYNRPCPRPPNYGYGSVVPLFSSKGTPSGGIRQKAT